MATYIDPTDNMDMDALEDAFVDTFEGAVKTLEKGIKDAFNKSKKSGSDMFYSLATSAAHGFSQSIQMSVEQSGISEKLGKILATGLKDSISGALDEADLADALNMKQASMDMLSAARSMGVELSDIDHDTFLEIADSLGVSKNLAEGIFESLYAGDPGDVFNTIEEAIASAQIMLDSMEVSNLAKSVDDEMKGWANSITDLIPSNKITKLFGIDMLKKEFSKALLQSGVFKGLKDKLIRVETDAETGKKTSKGLLAGFQKVVKKHPMKSLFAGGLIIGFFSLLFKALNHFSAQVDKVGADFGSFAVSSVSLRNNIIASGTAMVDLGKGMENTNAIIKKITSEFGGTFKNAVDVSTEIARMAVDLALTDEAAANVIGNFGLMGAPTQEAAMNLVRQTKQLALMNNLNPQDVFNEIAEYGADAALHIKGMGSNLVEATVYAKKLGVNLNTLTKTADALLDVQQSYQNELEASMLLGEGINLQKARELAYTGNLTGMMDEVLKQVGGIKKFNEMDYYTRKSISKLLNMDTREMQKFAKLQATSLEDRLKLKDVDAMELVPEESQGKLTLIINKFKRLGLQILEAIGPVIYDMLPSVDRIKEIVKNIQEFFGLVTDESGKVVQKTSRFQEIMQDVKSITHQILGLFLDWNEETQTYDKLGGSIGKHWETIVKYTKTAFYFFLAFKGAAMFVGMVKGLTMLTGAAKTAGSSLGKSIGGGVKGMTQGIKKGLGNIGSGIRSILTQVSMGINTALTQISAGIMTALNTLGPAISNFMTMVGKGIATTLKTLAGGIATTITTLASAIGTGVASIAAGLGTAISSILTGLATGLTAMGTGQVLFGVVNLGLMVGVFFLFGMAVQQFAGADWASVFIGIGALALLGVVAVILGYFAPMAILGAVAMGILAVGIYILGAAAVLFAEASGPLVDGFERMANLDGSKLLGAAGGITAIAGAIALFGGGSLIGGIATAIGNFFGGDPVEKFEKFANIGEPLNKAGTGIEKIANSMDLMTMDKFTSAGAGMEVMAKSVRILQGAMLTSLPILGSFYALMGADDLNEISADIQSSINDARSRTTSGPDMKQTSDSKTHAKLTDVENSIEELKTKMASLTDIMDSAFGRGGRFYSHVMKVREA